MPSGLIGRRCDDLFLSGMAALSLASFFVGFGRSYYLAVVFKAPLPNLPIHIHGALFSCWIVGRQKKNTDRLPRLLMPE